MQHTTPTIACNVIDVASLNDHVYRVILEPQEAFTFAAGQYVELVLPSGQACAFSIANAPHQTQLELHIRYNRRETLSGKVIHHLQNSKTVQILDAKGACTLDETASTPIIFIAASTCFAQIKGLLEYAFAKHITQPLYFYWGVRSASDFYLTDLPKQWAATYPNFTFVPVVAEASSTWHGRHGLVHKCVMQDFPTLKNIKVYACGSPAMINAVMDDFVLHGLDENEFYSDVLDYVQKSHSL